MTKKRKPDPASESLPEPTPDGEYWQHYMRKMVSDKSVGNDKDDDEQT